MVNITKIEDDKWLMELDGDTYAMIAAAMLGARDVVIEGSPDPEFDMMAMKIIDPLLIAMENNR